MKKSRDLHQAFEKLNNKYTEFMESNTLEGMDRIEIVSVIQQINRLTNKLQKFMNIVGRKFGE